MSKLDLVLVASDETQQVGFPVHQLIIAQHSPVLSSMLEEVELKDTYFAAFSRHLPCIPMVGDSPSAIRAALAFIYSIVSGASDYKAKQIAAASDSPGITLDKIPTTACQVDFALKYGMLGLQIAQESCLLEPVYNEIAWKPIKTTASQVLDCAAFAAKFNLGALLVMCEAHVIKYFECHANDQTQMEHKLPASSMFRIAFYFFYNPGGEQDSRSQICEELFKDYLKNPPASQAASAVILRSLNEGQNFIWNLRQLQECMKPQLILQE